MDELSSQKLGNYSLRQWKNDPKGDSVINRAASLMTGPGYRGLGGLGGSKEGHSAPVGPFSTVPGTT